MHRDRDRARCHAEFPAQGRAVFGGSAGQRRFQGFKQLPLAAGKILLPQPLDGVIENRLRPAPVERLIGCQLAIEDQTATGFRFLGINRDHVGSAAALLGVFPANFADQEVAQARQQVRAEAAFARPDRLEILAFDQARQVALDQVLGRVRVMTRAAEVGVKRRPVRPAELLQRFPGGCRRQAPGLKDQAPAGDRKFGV